MRKYLIRGSRKKSRLNLRNGPNPQAREAVREAIRDLERHQPVGLIQILSLSKAIGRRIRVHHPEENVDFTIGKRSKEVPIDLEYHDGHWTLKNEEDPEMVRVAANDCLFEAVAAQLGGSTPARIRHQTIQEMKFSESRIAEELEDIMFLEKWKDVLEMMSGGARYVGRSASDAGRVIDNSQNGTCHPQGMRGHPRGHASYPGGSGSTDSVENYSRSGWKTGFLSRGDQNLVGHLAFRTGYAQQAMDSLNDGATNEAVHISSRELGADDLPLACEFRNGERSGSPQRIQQVTAVFRHHSGRSNDRDADVFVHTFYPRL